MRGKTAQRVIIIVLFQLRMPRKHAFVAFDRRDMFPAVINHADFFGRDFHQRTNFFFLIFRNGYHRGGVFFYAVREQSVFGAQAFRIVFFPCQRAYVVHADDGIFKRFCKRFPALAGDESG